MHPEVGRIRIDWVNRGLGVVTTGRENQRVVELHHAIGPDIRIVVWRVHLDDHVAQILPVTIGTHVVSKLFNRATVAIRHRAVRVVSHARTECLNIVTGAAEAVTRARVNALGQCGGCRIARSVG